MYLCCRVYVYRGNGTARLSAVGSKQPLSDVGFKSVNNTIIKGNYSILNDARVDPVSVINIGQHKISSCDMKHISSSEWLSERTKDKFSEVTCSALLRAQTDAEIFKTAKTFMAKNPILKLKDEAYIERTKDCEVSFNTLN